MAIKLAPIFTDNMVIQRGLPLKIFGESSSADLLSVTIGGMTHTETIPAGAFCITMPALADTRNVLTLMLSLNGSSVCTLHNLVLGEVWLAGGQSNMEQPLFTTYNGFEDAEALANPAIRFFTVPRRPFPDAHIHGWHFEACVSDDTPWQICDADAALHFSAAGFYFAHALYEKYHVPVGVISCNWGGTRIETWMDFASVESSGEGANEPALQYRQVMEGLDMPSYLQKCEECLRQTAEALADSDAIRDAREQGPDEFARRGHFDGSKITVWPPYGPYDANRPGCLYENMIQRVAPYPMKGVLWYQGESNGGRDRSKYYAQQFQLMTADWRRLWGLDLPFAAVEIAPFLNAEGDNQNSDMWGYLREQQRIADDITPNTALIQIGDAGDKWNIHPCNKKIVGERLALAAENIAYHETVEYSGPVVQAVKRTDAGIAVTFSHVGDGLMFTGDHIQDFTMAAEGEQYQPADAVLLSKDTVLLTSPTIQTPVHIRYAFHNYPEINLFNSYKLPASPFKAKI